MYAMKEVKNKIIVAFVMIVSLLISGCRKVSAYEFPTNVYYFKIRDSSLGEITLYVPYNSIQNLSLQEDNQIINVGSSNVTAYANRNGDDFTVTFQVFQYGRYRLNNQSSYQFLDIQEIVDTNISFVNESDMYVHDNINVLNLSMCLIGGGLLFLLLLKR